MNLGTWRSQVVAIKQMNSQMLTQDQLNDFLREASVMQNMKYNLPLNPINCLYSPHPNIVQFLGITEHPFCIVTGILYDHILYDYIDYLHTF
jgi:serine/threonine protein kinase